MEALIVIFESVHVETNIHLGVINWVIRSVWEVRNFEKVYFWNIETIKAFGRNN